MRPFYADPDDEEGRRRWAVSDALRRYGTESSRLAYAFSTRHGLQSTDLQALVAIMSAEGRAAPLTPSRLRDHLGLSSGGTSYVIDRLEAAGHVRRVRDSTHDGRVVHLRYTPQGMATGLAFFGPLGESTNELMDQFTPTEIAAIARFLEAAVTRMQEHRLALVERHVEER